MEKENEELQNIVDKKALDSQNLINKIKIEYKENKNKMINE